MSRKVFNWAPDAARLLNGIFCIYKPEGIATGRVIEMIKENLARDLNKLPCYKFERLKKTKTGPSDIVPVKDVHDLSTGNQLPHYMPALTSVPKKTKDMSEHRLVLGDRYIPEDFEISHLTDLHKSSTGLLICGIGRANEDKMELLQTARYLSVYHVKGRFGYCTTDFSPTGPLIERTTFHHIKKVMIDRICATIQASHQRHVFEYAGVHPESEEAYQIASRGLVRPDTDDTPPLIYGVKCIDFGLPDVTLEMHAINEECMYLKQIVSDLGFRVKSSAVCSHIRRIRQGHFTLDHALLRKDWHLEKILDNIKLCRQFTKPEQLVTDFNIEQFQKNMKQLPSPEQKDFLLESDDKKSLKSGDMVEKYLKKLDHL